MTLEATGLAALDIDGTLARQGAMQVARPVQDAVDRFKAAGHHVVLASGRSLTGVLPMARELGLADGWVIASNGAITARLNQQTPFGYDLEDLHCFDPRPVV